jgi:Ankyrin repeats (3 copies)
MPKSSRKTGAAAVSVRAPQLARLLQDASSGKLGAIQRYLAAGGQPNALATCAAGDTAFQAPLLMVAVMLHHNENAGSIQALLGAGANAEASFVSPFNDEHRTALMMAASSCCEEPLRALLTARADACVQSTSDGATALHMAALGGDIVKCGMLIEASGGRVLNVCDNDGWPPVSLQPAKTS